MHPSKVCDPNWVRKAIYEYFEGWATVKEIAYLPYPVKGVSYYVESVHGDVYTIDQALFAEICTCYLAEDASTFALEA